MLQTICKNKFYREWNFNNFLISFQAIKAEKGLSNSRKSRDAEDYEASKKSNIHIIGIQIITIFDI